MHSNKKMPTLNSDSGVNITEHSGNVKINYKFMRFFKNATKINFWDIQPYSGWRNIRNSGIF